MICYHLKSDLDFMAPDLNENCNLFDELLLIFMKLYQSICVVDGIQYRSTAVSLFKESGCIDLQVNTFPNIYFVERWHPEINNFHMPFGEMTITLDGIYKETYAIWRTNYHTQ